MNFIIRYCCIKSCSNFLGKSQVLNNMNISVKSTRYIIVPWQKQIRFKSDIIKVNSANQNEESPIINLNENDDTKYSEQDIEQKRNKSRLLPQHRNMLHNKVPYSEPQSWIHETVKYQRTMFGRYGKNSGVYPGICWPTNEDLVNMKSYEQIAYPHTIQDMKRMNQQKQAEKEEELQKREKDIIQKAAKLEQWKEELKAKIAKKEMEAQKAKERKDRLIEEVRRHFGYTVDPRDERFKEMLEKKEKEQKKSEKEAKKKAKELKMLAKLQQQIESNKTDESNKINVPKQ